MFALPSSRLVVADTFSSQFRVPVMIPSAILLPIGFFWYGWSAEARIFWIMPDIGAAILAAAMICGYQASECFHSLPEP